MNGTMTRIGTGVVTALVAFTISASASAASFEKADRLYEKRGDNHSAIRKARKEYLKILEQASGKDVLRAVEQLGRLAIYQGNMLLPKSAKEKRRKIFGQCWKERDGGKKKGFVERLKDAGYGDHPAYFYFKGVCLSYWGEASGRADRLLHVGTLNSLLSRGFDKDIRYEGGGLARLAAGIYVNEEAELVGLYKPEEALEMAQASLDQDAYPGDPNPGNRWFGNWYAKARALDELGRTGEAKSVAQKGIKQIKLLERLGRLPEGRAPETRWALETLQQLVSQLDG